MLGLTVWNPIWFRELTGRGGVGVGGCFVCGWLIACVWFCDGGSCFCSYATVVRSVLCFFIGLVAGPCACRNVARMRRCQTTQWLLAATCANVLFRPSSNHVATHRGLPRRRDCCTKCSIRCILGLKSMPRDSRKLRNRKVASTSPCSSLGSSFAAAWRVILRYDTKHCPAAIQAGP